MADAPQVWLITGCSSGFGKSLAMEAHASGHRVIGTFRTAEAASAFSAGGPRQKGVVLDVADDLSVARGVGVAQAAFGRIDVLVNNAGIGSFGTVEEQPIDAVREQLEINLIGTIRMLKAILPMMREQRSGLVVQMSSVSGHVGLPGLGGYAASKFALEGLSDSLAAELEPFGISVMIVAPGPFRTPWVTNSRNQAHPGQIIADYSGGPAAQQIEKLNAIDGKQPGDPRKASRLIVEAAAHSPPPRRLIVGTIAMDRVRDRLKTLANAIAAWETASARTACATSENPD